MKVDQEKIKSSATPEQASPTVQDYEEAIRQIQETGTAIDPDTGEPMMGISQEFAIRDLQRRIDNLRRSPPPHNPTDSS